MRDLTTGSITNHTITLAAPVVVSMLTQVAYQLVDLYFVSRISAAATAGVNAAGSALLVLSALAQMLNVGAAALVAQAVGARDRTAANLIFNQSLVLATALASVSLGLLYACTRTFLEIVAADAATVDSGATFMRYALPGFALLLPLTAAGAALRGTGVVRPYIAIHMLTVLINAALAPMLIAGWGTGLALGVAGAGLATTLSVVVGIALLAVYLRRPEHYLVVRRTLLRPCFDHWSRILKLGLPAGCELMLTFLSTAVMYYAIRTFGAAAQAGLGIGTRVLQVVLLPALAIGLAAGPIVGQNFGAANATRVQQTFGAATLISAAVMALTTFVAQQHPRLILGAFDADFAALDAATLFLQSMSWAFVAQGIVYVCSSTFQGLGSTVPALVSSAARFALFCGATAWLISYPRHAADAIWTLASASIVFQAIVSLWLVRVEFRRRLRPPLSITEARCH